MTLNDHEWLFYAKFWFHVAMSGIFCMYLENSCIKTHKDKPILSMVAMYVIPGTLVSGNISFIQIFVGVL